MTAEAAHDLAPADAAWLAIDRPANPMVIHALARTTERIDFAQAVTTVEHRWIEPFERLRQRIEPARRGSGGHARWRTVSGLCPSDHVRHVELPDSDVALEAFLDQAAGRPLDLSRPPWEIHVIDRTGGGSDVLFRIHHALLDGHVFVRLLRALDEGGPTPPLQNVRRPRGSGSSEVQSARASIVSRGVGRLLHPERAFHEMAGLASLGSVALPNLSVPRPFLRRVTGRKRPRFVGPFPLASIQSACHARGVTVNDFWMAAVTGALRGYLRARRVGLANIRAVVPVDLRERDAPLDPALGNVFGLVFATLPIREREASSRLLTIKKQMDERKASDQAKISFDWIRLAGTTPGLSLIDVFARHCGAILSNIRASAAPVVFGGAPVRALVPWVPTAGPIGLGVCVASYAGAMHAGLWMDEGIIEDPEGLSRSLRDEVDALIGHS